MTKERSLFELGMFTSLGCNVSCSRAAPFSSVGIAIASLRSLPTQTFTYEEAPTIGLPFLPSTNLISIVWAESDMAGKTRKAVIRKFKKPKREDS